MANEINLRRRFLGPAGAGIAGGSARGRLSGGASYDVKAFGATGGGKALDTAAVNEAVAAAAAAGGGTVHFPAGSYLSYSIHPKSNVVLNLGPGATIVAAGPAADGGGAYDLPQPAARFFDPSRRALRNSGNRGRQSDHR